MALSSHQDVVVRDLVAIHAGRRGALLPLLHAIQRTLGFVPDDAVPLVAAGLNLSRAEVHGVITFYHDFRRKPAGAHVVRLCRGESCQARGGRIIERRMVDRLGVKRGATRADGRVTLEAVYCLGLCAIGPNATVDGQAVSRIDAEAVERIAEAVDA